MENSENIIQEVQELLKEKHSKYTPERYCHYVVKGEHEEECGTDDYCEKCIDKGIRKVRDRYLQKRGLEQGRARQLMKFGYVFYVGYNTDFEARGIMMHVPTEKEKKRYLSEIKKKYKDPIPVYSYRYYHKDSDTSFRLCEGCGIIIECCVTADEQEIQHWESLNDEDFNIEAMDEVTAYEIYEIMDLIHQAKPDVFERGVKLAERILILNKYT